MDAKPEPDVDAILGRVMETVGAKNDHQLAQKTGTAQTTISTWRSKRRIPYELCATIALQHLVSFDWLIFGRVAEKEISHNAGYGLIDLNFFEVCYKAAHNIVEKEPSVSIIDAAVMVYNARYKTFIDMITEKLNREQATFAWSIFDSIDVYDWDTIAKRIKEELGARPNVKIDTAVERAG